MNNDKMTRFNSLFSICELHGLKNEDALKIIGELDDLSAEFQSMPGLDKANSLADELGKRRLLPAESSYYHYCRANIWSDIRHMKTQNNTNAWAWEQDEIDNEILISS